MSYAETLERLKKLEGAPDGEVSKVPKAPFGTYGTPEPGASRNFQASGTSGGCHLKALSRPPNPGGENSRRPRVGTGISDKRVVPLVRCRDCQHFEPDHVNPAQGIGRCRIGAAGDPADRDYRQPYPANPRRCDQFEITPEALLALCREVCSGLDVDAEALARWLTKQHDPEWLTPAAVKRWAEVIEQRGFPNE